MSKTKLETEFEKLNKQITELTENVQEIIDMSITSFEKIDLNTLGTIKNLDVMVYHKIKYIEAMCIEILALQSPIASDLRKIFTILEILTDLDRIGRYAYDISLETPYFVESGHVKDIEEILAMTQLAKNMVNVSIKSFLDKDIELAKSLVNEDEKVDEMYKRLMKKVIEYMKNDVNNISPGVHYILVGRYLERMADHAVNIGDRTIYMLTGEKVIHL